jgi:hypothetical protein
MFPEVFLFGCRLAELSALLFSANSLPRSCWLDKSCFLGFLLGLGCDEFVF